MGIAVIASYLVKYFEEKDQYPLWHAYAYATSIGVVVFTSTMIHHQTFFWTNRVGWRMRVAVCALMYKKVKFGI